MPEQMVRLRKRTGGNSLEWEGSWYSWPADDPVTEVPYELAVSLLAIPDGGYKVEGDPQPQAHAEAPVGLTQTADTAGLGGSEEDGGEDEEVTEPAPEGEDKVTEPAPPPQKPASPVTAKPRAATAKRQTGSRSRSTASRGGTGRAGAK